MLRRSLLLTAVLCPLVLGGCSSGLSNKELPLAVSVPQDCETLLEPVAHYPVIVGKTDARIAYKGEYGRTEQANERIESAKGCLVVQREGFAGAGK